MPERTIKIEIKRQSGPDAAAHWDKFEIPYRPGMNVISSMMEIATNPVTTDGKPTTPIAYDSNCLEEICGSCAMLINGKAKMACSALIDNLEQPVRLEPLSKFPVVRDLAVDRSVLFENLKRVKAWVPVDGTYDLGPGPRIFPQSQEESYPLSNCISCTICMEACPQFNEDTGFVGAATIAQGQALQRKPHREGAQRRASPRAHGRRRHRRLRLRPKLCQRLPQRTTAHSGNFRRQPRRDRTKRQGLLHALAFHECGCPRFAKLTWVLDFRCYSTSMPLTDRVLIQRWM